MQNLQNDLIDILNHEGSLVIDGQLNKNRIVEMALQVDPKLIKHLLKNDSLKRHFFTDVEGVLVFDKIKFQRFVNNKSFLPDSYTAFKNKIGLTINDGTTDNYIISKNDVVLSWPHKDCVLEGGQTKEDQKRNEIFWNETLAPDEIDRLLDPKVLTNWKKYDLNGEHEVTEISNNDNLIIKGNNLLALASLKKRYSGIVKLIYIDPPYNTSGAANTFSYNNTFNHSAWLSFMKNRIEIAKSLLKRDGILVVAIDHFELFYLGVLLDECFGRENRMGVISVVHNPGGRQDDQFFPTAHENMLFYAKDITCTSINTLGLSDEKMNQFKFSDKWGNYKLRGFRRSGSNSLKSDRPGLFYPIYYNEQKSKIFLERTSPFDIELLPIDEEGTERCWRWGPTTLMEKLEKYIEIKKTKNGIELYTKERESDYQGEKAKTIWNKPYYTGQTGTNELKNEFGKKVFSYPKSPYLIRDIIQISTQPHDIVLDFFAGSGTTAAVSLSLDRFFIGIEQMDYIEDIPVSRIFNAIKGAESGYYKEVNWQGGGSFIYCELAKYNQIFVDQILVADNKEKLIPIWQLMKDKAFLSYQFDKQTFDERIEAFKTLSTDDQKKFLLETLDKNQLYVNYSEIEDETFGISKEDKYLNKAFYLNKF
ncbi:MAG: site-specific DNA-methyltransferase [Bacteroidales bacterium]|nr:site-specific DNA-methyltransferase [Bacteroidales bacterium]